MFLTFVIIYASFYRVSTTHNACNGKFKGSAEVHRHCLRKAWTPETRCCPIMGHGANNESHATVGFRGATADS